MAYAPSGLNRPVLGGGRPFALSETRKELRCRHTPGAAAGRPGRRKGEGEEGRWCCRVELNHRPRPYPGRALPLSYGSISRAGSAGPPAKRAGTLPPRSPKRKPAWAVPKAFSSPAGRAGLDPAAPAPSACRHERAEGSATRRRGGGPARAPGRRPARESQAAQGTGAVARGGATRQRRIAARGVDPAIDGAAALRAS